MCDARGVFARSEWRGCVAIGWVAALAGCGAALPRATAPSHVLVFEHRSAMADAFTLVRVVATVDGETWTTIERDVAADAGMPTAIATPICLGRREVTSGPHELTLQLTYAGHGYGVFSYLDAYRFRVSGRHTVDVPDEAVGVVVTSTGYEHADVPLEERPQVDWRAEVMTDPSAGCRPSE